jgi:hypothetical protein
MEIPWLERTIGGFGPGEGKPTRQIEIAKGIFIPGWRLRFGMAETIYLDQRFLRQENRG